jgi:hypothetical protein
MASQRTDSESYRCMDNNIIVASCILNCLRYIQVKSSSDPGFWHTVDIHKATCSCADSSIQSCWHAHFVRMLIYESQSLTQLRPLLPRRVADVYSNDRHIRTPVQSWNEVPRTRDDADSNYVSSDSRKQTLLSIIEDSLQNMVCPLDCECKRKCL